VLIAAADLVPMEATPELLGDPGAQSRIARREQDLVRGDVLADADVRALLAGRRKQTE
jgi:hypothetical protein